MVTLLGGSFFLLGMLMEAPLQANEGNHFVTPRRNPLVALEWLPHHPEVENEVVWAHADVKLPAHWTSLGEVEEAFPKVGRLHIHRHLTGATGSRHRPEAHPGRSSHRALGGRGRDRSQPWGCPPAATAAGRVGLRVDR